MAGRFTVEAVFKAIDKVTAPVSRMQNRMGKFTRGMSKGLGSANRMVDGVLGKLRRVAVVGAAAFAVLGVAMGDVIMTGAKFEQQMVIAAGKMGKGIEKGTAAFRELEGAARRSGETTEFTATQSAEALTFLAQAGFGAKAAMAALPRAIDFATASQGDLAETTRIATKSMGAFNLLAGNAETKMKNMRRVTDLMVKTSNNANTSLDEMFDALTKGAPAALKAGASIEDVAVMIAAFADVGIDASTAGVGVRQMMLAIGAPGDDAAKIMRRLGVETTQTINGLNEMRKPLAVFEDFKRALAKKGGADQLQILKAIFGKRAAGKAIALINQSGAAVKDLQNRLLDYGGEVERIARQNRDTVAGSYLALLSSIEAVKLSIFSANKGPIKDLLDNMTRWIRLNRKTIASNINGIIQILIDKGPFIAKLAKTFGVLIVTITSLIVVLKLATMAMVALDIAMAANPVGLIIIGIGILITTMVAVIAVTVIWRKEIEGLWESMPLAAKIFLLINPITRLVLLGAMLINNWGAVKTFFGTLFDGVISKAQKLLDVMRDIKEFKISGIGGKIVGLFSEEKDVKGEKTVFHGPTSQVIGPQQRAANATGGTTNRSEVTIRPAAGTEAELTAGVAADGLKLLPSGAF